MQGGLLSRLQQCIMHRDVLSKATDQFASTHLVGTGASCRVFRAELYGRAVAVKMFNETAGKWDDKQVRSKRTRLPG